MGSLFCYYAFGFIPANSYADTGLRINQQLVNTTTMETTQLDVSYGIFSNQKPSYTQYNGSNNNRN